MNIQVYISGATLLAVLGLWGRMYLMNFQFNLMWRDYCKRKGIPYNGDSDSGTTTSHD